MAIAKLDPTDVMRPSAIANVTATNALIDAIDTAVMQDDIATDAAYGIVKTNSAQSITLNADGQLEVGGRLGQFPGTTGIYASADRDPRAVGNNSFLITDAMGMSLDTGRAFALVSGYGVTCKSASPPARAAASSPCSLAYPRPTQPIIPFPITLRFSRGSGTISSNLSASPRRRS